ncbi:hypothetical protein LCGC14_0598870 [marine sediment metagenome]|uniref:Uncharacterized protein n=1 Tax=marine sediment metagenome TaxID=412755 RepID=A0A0F9RG52_9ZZZZ
MKEIKILIQQLRNYPNNFFVYPVMPLPEGEEHNRLGLRICDHLGEEQGFIEIGGKEGVIIQ